MRNDLKTRKLRLESLEERTLLAVTSGGGGPQDAEFVSAAPMPAGSAAPTVDIDIGKLSSKPGSSYSIYLDFDGHVTSGTEWNTKYTGGKDFSTPRFTVDGNTNKQSFSPAERAAIYEIWLRVAEDFMPFDVNVTTVEPSKSAFAAGRAQRVVIGGKYSDWYKSRGSGASYVGTFSRKGDLPNYVFSESIGGGNIKAVAQSVTHETGHTLGLKHKGNRLIAGEGEYFSGLNGWGPIMGNPDHQELTQWSKGEYKGASNTDDELSVITGQNGFGYRVDDYAGSFDGARRLSIVGGNGKISGIIERNNDVDVFVFVSDGSPLSFSVGGIAGVTNLDVLVKLYSEKRQLIKTYNPADRLDVEFVFTGGAGSYYLTVEGAGLSTGWQGIYSDYGSLGAYTVRAGSPENLVVTTLNDSFANDGFLSLREALVLADDRTVISFDRSLAGGTIRLTSGEISLDRSVTIDASSVGGITIDAGGKSRVLTVTGGNAARPVTLVGLTITGGNAADGGGGISVKSSLKLTNCTVTGNTSAGNSYGGGGLFVFSTGSVAIVNSVVSKNTASAHYGGGIYNAGAAVITGSLISANSADSPKVGIGGGIFNSGTLTVVGSTVSGNAGVNGGGIYVKSGAVALTNSILAFNGAGSNADIKGAYSGSHNIVGSDPGFTAAPVFISGKLANAESLDFSLTEKSAAIDTGANDAVDAEFDLAGNPRITGGTVDIGAYEYRGNVEEPSTVVTTLSDIVDDVDGLISLREAVLYAADGDTVTFDRSLAGGTVTLGGTQLEIAKRIGFDASSIGGITIDAAGQSRVFCVAAGSSDAPVTLNGLTMTGGSAESGGAIYNTGALRLIRCAVIGSRAADLGGGIYNGADLTLIESAVSGNTAARDGGGLYNVAAASAALTNTFLTGNTAESHYGGGIYNAGALSVIGSVISANSAENNVGGGIFNSGALTIVGSTVSGNAAKNGGGIYTTGENASLSNTIVAANYSPYTKNIKGSYSAGAGGNIVDADPGFAAAPVFVSGKLVNAETLDLSITPESAALDAGSNGAALTETDIAGNPRISGVAVDIGAYEYQVEIETPSTVVTTALDVVDMYDGEISLREAVFYADDGAAVTFGDALAGGRIVLNGSALDIAKSVGIDASSIGGITIDAGGKSRVFSITVKSPDSPVTLTGLTMTGGSAGDGGAIYNTGSLSLKRCAVTGNTASHYGGGIYNAGALSVTNSEISANSANASVGGGIFTSGTLTIVGSTVSGNTAKNGGGIYISSAAVTLTNSIVAFNDASSNGDIRGSYSGGSSLVGSDPGFAAKPVFESGALTNSDAMDLALARGSAAIDAGANDAVDSETDLAGNPRIVGEAVDIGAYEYQESSAVPLDPPGIISGRNAEYVSCGANRHRIAWNAVENAVGYELAYSSGGGTNWISVPTTETSAVVGGLTYGSEMIYRVRALGSGSFENSAWSPVKVFSVCPMDINGDGDISGADRTVLAGVWLAEEGDENFLAAADINGDGENTGADRSFLSGNWLNEAGEDEMFFPRPKAADAAFAGYEPGGLDVGGDLF